MKWIFVFVTILWRCKSLLLPIELNCQGASEKNFIFPILVPRIAQDPQNYPEEKTHYFNFKTGGKLVVKLQTSLIPDNQQRKLSNVAETVFSSTPKLRIVPFSQKTTNFLTNCFHYIGLILKSLGGGIVGTFMLNYKQNSKNSVKQITTALFDAEISHKISKSNANFKLFDEINMQKSLNKKIDHFSDENFSMVNRSIKVNLDTKKLYYTNQTYLLLLSELQLVNLIGFQIKNSTPDPNKWKAPLVLQDKAFNSYIQSTVRMALSYHRTHFTYTIHNPGNYVVMLLNSSPSPVYISGVLELVNPDNVHLSAQDEAQGPALLGFVCLNLATTIVILIKLLTTWSNTRTDLHSLMTFNFFMKCLYLTLDWYNNKLFSRFGELSTLNWLLPRMIAKIQDIILLMMFLLLALGWKIHRYQLSLSEIRFCAVICILSFYLGIFEVSMGGFQATRYILHSLAYLCIFVAINFNITLIANTLTEMGLSRTTAATYRKIEGYAIFKIVFIIFILKPTLLLFYKLTILFEDDTDDWLLLIFDNVVDWSICVALVYAFRPFKNFKLFEDLKIENELRSMTEESMQVERDSYGSLEDALNPNVS